MKKEIFKLLLTDLYNVYNPSNVLYVDQLVEKYHHLEADSVKNIFLKYNRRGTPHYDPNKNSDEYILDLIKKYSNGERVFQNVTLDDLANEMSDGKEEQETSKVKIIKETLSKELREDVDAIKNEIKKDLEKQFKTINDLVNDKTKQFKELEKTINEKSEELQKEVTKKLTPKDENDFEVRIAHNFKGKKPILPDEKILLKLGVKSRIIARDEEGGMDSYIISDISCDMISEPERPIIEIWIEKEAR